jgi:hypothetical protein
VRGLRQGLTEDERYLVADDVLRRKSTAIGTGKRHPTPIENK